MKILLFIIPTISAYKICVVGGASRLGRELVYQSTTRHNSSTIALIGSKQYIHYPVRRNDLLDDRDRDVFQHPKLDVCNYWTTDFKTFDYEHLIFSICAPPFQNDYSDELMRKMLLDLPKKCKSITMIHTSQKMNWFIKDTIRANDKKELLAKQTSLKRLIFRPATLSNEEPKSRKRMANRILNNIHSKHLFK